MHLSWNIEFLFNSGFQPNQKTDKQGIYWELMEGVRTEELSGSNLHKWSKSSYQKRTKIFFYSLPISYQNQIEKSILSKSLSLEFPTDCIGFTDILPFYIWGL
jgi:hypothetical protein